MGAASAISATAMGIAWVCVPFTPSFDEIGGSFCEPFFERGFVAMAEQFGDLFFEILQAVGGGQVERIGIEVFERATEDVVDHLVLEDIGIGLVEHAECWIEPGLGGVVRSSEAQKAWIVLMRAVSISRRWRSHCCWASGESAKWSRS